ncbi:protein of unknown function [Candidatus Methylomirabilis oxygeniifera]|uniref:Uncharacterized protein n=1 Tax=Methylomirabilis oxygeniifera TaxID=671143 RepID=D5MJY2_METO1|nr:protein of unknown function [Candidatus Methylomirabilis oxyfera]
MCALVAYVLPAVLNGEQTHYCTVSLCAEMPDVPNLHGSPDEPHRLLPTTTQERGGGGDKRRTPCRPTYAKLTLVGMSRGNEDGDLALIRIPTASKMSNNPERPHTNRCYSQRSDTGRDDDTLAIVAQPTDRRPTRQARRLYPDVARSLAYRG